MASFQWVTDWRIEAPVADVWDVIYDTSNWPQWWSFVEEAAEIRPGDASGVGSLWRYVWRTRLWYKIRFDMTTVTVEPRRKLAGEASGKVVGHGTWTFSEQNGITTVRYEWNIATNVWWMNLFAPLLRPFFNWNHDQVMKAGGEGLARRLGTRLLDAPGH
jgi:uncharacterized protein YndB with AHSA1/START domain